PRPSNLPDHRFKRHDDLADHACAVRDSGLEGDVDDWHPAANFIDRGHYCCLGHFRHGQTRGLEFLGPQPMSRDVDDVVDATQNPEVAVRWEYCTVRGKVRPITPVLALPVPAVLPIVLRDETIGVTPNGLHDAGPRVSNTDVAGSTRTGRQ